MAVGVGEAAGVVGRDVWAFSAEERYTVPKAIPVLATAVPQAQLAQSRTP